MSSSENTESTFSQLPSGTDGGTVSLPQGTVNALETHRSEDPASITIFFKAVGNAPIMKRNTFTIPASRRFQNVILFLRKTLGLKAADPLNTYINSTFSPAPDDTLSNLSKSFSTGGQLIVNYSTVPAWG